jgi:serine-protein kinase ATM
LRLTPSDKLVQDLFEPASRMLRENSVAHDPVIGKVSFQYAVFCTAQLEDQVTIADLKRLDALYHSKRAEVDRYSAAIRDAELRKDSKSLSRLTRDRDRAQKLVKMDKAELNRLHKHQQTFLEKAVENFLSCFTASSDYDHYVPKFTSIWLKHSNKSEVNSSVMKSLGLVPSFKFLPLLHQLCSRLSDDAGEFQILLSSLLSRILHDHPYHSVHQIFSAKHSTGDLAATKRASAAKSLLEAMSKTVKMGDISLYHLTMRLEKQFSSYSDLASLPTTAKAPPSDSFSFDSFPTLREFQSKKMDPLRLPPPGMEITVQSDRDYRSVPYVQNYSRTFNIAGGVNRPKILDSILSDGRRFRELVRPLKEVAYS